MYRLYRADMSSYRANIQCVIFGCLNIKTATINMVHFLVIFVNFVDFVPLQFFETFTVVPVNSKQN